MMYDQPINPDLSVSSLEKRKLRVISIIDGLIFTVFEGNYHFASDLHKKVLAQRKNKVKIVVPQIAKPLPL